MRRWMAIGKVYLGRTALTDEGSPLEGTLPAADYETPLSCKGLKVCQVAGVGVEMG